ncbi:MAG: nicotinate-nucleotide adenylyltransferase [Paracoccus sp. (in: a-proteobacteria)]|nr:nicotinate-nucleotide adenylyltransferase [Paracoccus sp. (in: a-proteobacteria)]
MTQPFPVARPGQRIGLFGGSFDPAHEGHVRLTEEALRSFGLDRVWWLVTPGNPLKSRQPAAMSHRIKQARALLSDPRVVVTGIEERLGTRLTADTIAALQRHYPGVRFTWLMGSDNLVQFSEWERWQDIAQRVPIGVIARPGSRLRARRSRAAQILARYRLREEQSQLLGAARPPAWVMVNMPLSNASSTAIRAAKAAHADSARRAP